MAIGFDEANDYYDILDDPSLTLQDGDWCIGVWTRLADNGGTGYQYLLNNNIGSGNNYFYIYIEETDVGDPEDDCWIAQAKDGDGTFSGYLIAGATGGDDLWRLIIFQRNTASNQFELWFCQPNQAPTLEDTSGDANFNAVDGGDWDIGRRVDGHAARYYGGIACEFFKGDFVLSSDEIRQLGRGLRVYDLGHIPDVYLEMFSADATLRDVFEGNDATRHDAPTTVDHAPVRSPKLPVGVL